MSYFSCLVLLFAGINIATAGRIVGGVDTTIEDFPGIVQLEYWIDKPGYWVFGCAANILTSRWLLSAAHCFTGLDYSPEWTRVRAGSTTLNAGGDIYHIDHEINHPDFGEASRYDADITVVKLTTPLVFSAAVRPSTLITHGFQLPDNYRLTIIGWGHTSWDGTSPKNLQVTHVNTINQELCAQRYEEVAAEYGADFIVTDNMFCAGILDVGGQGACQGDSGGPLYAQGPNGLVVVGIPSWTYKCANGTYPGVNTNVAKYTNWVIENARG